MSGSDIVSAYRDLKAKRAKTAEGRWRLPTVVLGIAVSVVGFGSIVVKAGDGAGVYDIARSYTSARGTPRFQVPQIFQPAPRIVPSRTTSYAPSPALQHLAPMQSTGKRSVDQPRRIQSVTIRAKANKTELAKSTSKKGNLEDSYLHSSTAYCVRSCDGFYFPIGNSSNSGSPASQAACDRACPGAESSVFVASAGSKGIEDAINRRGQRYQATTTAFNYRTQLSSACTCNGQPGTPRNYSLLNDFTLRSGDLVMSREGLKVFRGNGESYPFKRNQFASANSAGTTSQEKRWLEQTEASSIRGMVGAKVSRSLQDRITAQLNAAKGRQLAKDIGLRGIESTITVSDGRQLRYVGPHAYKVQ